MPQEKKKKEKEIKALNSPQYCSAATRRVSSNGFLFCLSRKPKAEKNASPSELSGCLSSHSVKRRKTLSRRRRRSLRGKADPTNKINK